MATTLSPSSLSPYDEHIPTATVALPSIASNSASRRLPPPCWSHDETVALIDAYRDKWYSLRRGNLRASHWQEVADEIAVRCSSSTPKTAVQCRHKMEKLRKRYRSEIQRATQYGSPRQISSSWVHFQSMHSMEKGPKGSPSSDEERHEEEDHKNSIYDAHNNNYSNRKGNFSNQGLMSNMMNGVFRIKIPGVASAGRSAPKVYGKFNEMGGKNSNNPHPHPKINSTSSGNGYRVSGKDLREMFMGRDEMG
ncbi:uncharacterized protein LOC111378461 [Olea europaea var. sylvestris]|uniref:uncharacterized protein LOC111378461 n=1 Tax=Olea europaea var. sylvestris TaxID=158386 RepID=UPI000C1D6500|nr:uncharacterized protein LOC111378461 [Olea europaea var. sylvestris]